MPRYQGHSNRYDRDGNLLSESSLSKETEPLIKRVVDILALTAISLLCIFAIYLVILGSGISLIQIFSHVYRSFGCENYTSN